MEAPARITGRIRRKDNAPGKGYSVEFYVGRTKVGSSETSADGSFKMELPDAGRRSPRRQFAHIWFFNKEGDPVLKTSPARLTGGVLDLQVKLGKNLEGGRESDIYEGNMRRLAGAYRKLEGRLDPSSDGVIEGLISLVKMIERWTDDRKLVERAGASKVVQVPKHPKKVKHQHVSVWDEVVLRS